MQPSEDYQELYEALEGAGRKGRIVSIGRLRDLKRDIQGAHKRNLFDPDFYREWLTDFDFQPPRGDFTARSILIVATPAPQYRVTFQWGGQDLPLIVPPTYLFGKEVDSRTAAILEGYLAPRGYSQRPAKLPKKLTAVRSGLARYGRNNISYVEGMGSFHRLAVFFSDLLCKQDAWQEPALMTECEKCTACRKRCPTGAIGADRFLLHAERCITYYNEKDGSVAFPADLAPAWHNCLVGCMLCQRACPQDAPYWEWVEEGPHFDSHETRLFCQGVELAQLPKVSQEKLAAFDLEGMLSTWPRNLGVFMGLPA
ncbi:MAG: 4Fe-4S double cluster binding domain-containing protein [Anaerolineales bacterium]|nr:4Fe-4S double cluster binding domain-containing protein [Anaerolineales bacterium]